MAAAAFGFSWWFCYLAVMSLCPPTSVQSPCPSQHLSLFGEPCAGNMCLCSHDSAGCSGRIETVAYIPRLSHTTVDLSCNNKSSAFFTRNAFANLTAVRHLDLSYNNITWLSRDVFARMKTLRYLKLNGNEALNLSTIAEILSIQSLVLLSVKNCNLVQPPAHLFQKEASHIKTLELDTNPHSGTYNLGGFCPLQSLETLSLKDCDFKAITSPCPLQKLQSLDLTGNALRRFPKTCVGDEPIFPNLITLILRRNRVDQLSASEVCLPSLKLLDMSYNFMTVYPAGSFSSAKFPSLENIYLKYQSTNKDRVDYKDVSFWRQLFLQSSRIEAYAFDNPNILHLNLRDNKLTFVKDYSVHPLAFANCSGLKHLDVSANNFLRVDDQRLVHLFGHMQSLMVLFMSDNKFQSVSRNTFAIFPQLTTLALHNNLINKISDGAFNSLANLQQLSLDNNKIKTVHENTFTLHKQTHLRYLTLAFNPFFCSCDLVWFQRWFHTQTSFFTKLYVSANDYKCDNIPDMTLANFAMTEQACLLSREVNVLLIQCCSTAIFSLTLVALVFRYRWHIRLLMYEMFRGRDVLRRQRLQENNFDFDLFVSYASDDLPWVRQELIANLENRLGLKLCVHERDFVPGRNIVDNIVQCVESSKKVLMVFSQHFVRSQWCQFELSLCLSHVMDYDDALIVVCVDDVTSRQMTSAMMGVLKTTTYIQWGEQGDPAVSFWGRLYLALHEVVACNEQGV